MSPIEPSQARYRSTEAIARLTQALGLQRRAEEEDCLILERLASQAERWARFDRLVDCANSTRRKAYEAGYGSDECLPGEGEP